MLYFPIKKSCQTKKTPYVTQIDNGIVNDGLSPRRRSRLADFTCVRQDHQLVVRSQDFSLTLPDTWANQQVLFIVFRALGDPRTGKQRFPSQKLAEGCGDQHRQHIQHFQQAFEQSGGDRLAYLQRTRNVDATVVAAVTEAIRPPPLASVSRVCQQVSAQ